MGRYVVKFGQISTYKEWELPHISQVKIGIKKTCTAYGIPTKSSQSTNIFDMQGPVRTFSFSFKRLDWEEDIANWDFMFGSGTKDGKGNKYIGLDYFMANLQVNKPYRLQIYWQGDDATDTDPKSLITGRWNVSVTKSSFGMASDKMGEGSFNLELVERNNR